MRRLAILGLAAVTAACVHDGGSASAPTSAEVARNADLKTLVERRLAQTDGRAFRAVQVDTWRGRVLLVGAVVKPEHRRRAEQAARTADGAAEVLNELVLAEDKALELFAPDPVREAKVRARVGPAPVVRVVNGVAFLMGAASPDRAAAMKADAGEVDGIKWVVGHFSAP